MTGLKLPPGSMERLLAVNKKEWLAELDSIEKFFDQFGSRLPDEMWSQHERLRQRLLASKT